MNIVFIGSGNVATVLSGLCRQKGHHVLQIMSRNPVHGRELAVENNCKYTDLSGLPDPSADVIIVAVSDDGLNEKILPVRLEGKLIIHTAGSVSKNILSPISSSCGVMWPLQTLRKEMKHIPEIPFLVDGATMEVTEKIKNFAASLSSMVSIADDVKRKKLHLAAVVVNNFTNHLYSLAEQFCLLEGLDFKMLVPLMKETANRAGAFSPSAIQTGPACRNDLRTIDSHLTLLENNASLKELYKILSESIMKQCGNK